MPLFNIGDIVEYTQPRTNEENQKGRLASVVEIDGELIWIRWHDTQGLTAMRLMRRFKNVTYPKASLIDFKIRELWKKQKWQTLSGTNPAQSVGPETT